MIMGIKMWLAKSGVDIGVSFAVLTSFYDKVLERLDIALLGLVIVLANAVLGFIIYMLKHSMVRFLKWLRKVTPDTMNPHIDKAEEALLQSLKKAKKQAEKDLRQEAREHAHRNQKKRSDAKGRKDRSGKD